MFDELFNTLKDLIGSKVQETAKDIGKRFAVPDPAEPFTIIHKFTSTDSTIVKGGVVAIEEGWQIEAYDDNPMRLNIAEPLRSVVLFEVSEPPNTTEGVLACRFQARTLNSEKSIEVKLVLCKQQRLGTTARAWSANVSRSEGFQPFELRAHFKKDSVSAKVQIAAEFECSGILQIKNIELLQAPVRSES